MEYNEYNKQEMLELLAEVENSLELSSHLHEAYMILLANKLTVETGYRFIVMRDCIKNESFDISIHSNNIENYKGLKAEVDKKLATYGTTEDGVKIADLVGAWAGHTKYCDLNYNEDERVFTGSGYSRSFVFEVLYYALTNKWHENLHYVNELEKKYIPSCSYYKGKIEELGIDIQFCKNGKIKILSKKLPTNFWDKVKEFYTVCCPIGRLRHN